MHDFAVHGKPYLGWLLTCLCSFRNRGSFLGGCFLFVEFFLRPLLFLICYVGIVYLPLQYMERIRFLRLQAPESVYQVKILLLSTLKMILRLTDMYAAEAKYQPTHGTNLSGLVPKATFTQVGRSTRAYCCTFHKVDKQASIDNRAELQPRHDFSTALPNRPWMSNEFFLVLYSALYTVEVLQVCQVKAPVELTCEHVPEKEAVGGGSVVVSLSRMG